MVFASTTSPSGPRGQNDSTESVYNADLGNVIKDGYPFDRALDYGMEQLFLQNTPITLFYARNQEFLIAIHRVHHLTVSCRNS